MSYDYDDRNVGAGRFAIGCGAFIAVGIISFLLVLASGSEVGAGYVGVQSSFGAIDKDQAPLAPGFHVVMPFTTHIDSISVQPQNHAFREVQAASKELQNVYVDGGVNYHIDARRAAEIQIEGGVDAIVAKVFDPAFQDYIKEVVPQYGASDILASRSKIRDAVKGRLSDKASAYGMSVDDVFITNIKFDRTYTDAIEKAAVAQQQLNQAKNEAAAKVAAAQGDADANRLRQTTLTAEQLQYLALQNQKDMIARWNGQLPQVSGAANPFINLTPTK